MKSRFSKTDLTRRLLGLSAGTSGGLPYMGYIGMYRCIVFKKFTSGIRVYESESLGLE